MSTDTERRELVRPDATIAYWVSGPERAPVVVLLHGATLDHHAWDAQVDALTPRYRVVVPDLRGHGESTLEGAFRFDDAVDDVAALLDEVDDGRAGRARRPEPGRQHRPGDRAPRRPTGCDALVVADSTCNTAARHPLAAPLDDRHAVGDGAGRRASGSCSTRRPSPSAARRRAPVRPGRQRGPHDPRGPADPSVVAGPGALHPDPDYRLPVPTLLLHGADDRVGDIVAGSREWAARDPLVELRGDPRRRARQQPGQPGGVHRGADGLPRPGPARARAPASRPGGARPGTDQRPAGWSVAAAEPPSARPVRWRVHHRSGRCSPES